MGSEMCIRDRFFELAWATPAASLFRQKSRRTWPLYRLREHRVLDHIHAELVADALAPTHVLELLLEAPARDAEGKARLVRQWGSRAATVSSP